MLLMVEPSSCSAARRRWGFPQHTCRRRRGLREPVQLPSAFGRSKDADVPSCCSFRLVCLLGVTHFKYPGMLTGTRCRWGAASAHNRILFLACVDERVVSHTTCSAVLDQQHVDEGAHEASLWPVFLEEEIWILTVRDLFVRKSKIQCG